MLLGFNHVLSRRPGRKRRQKNGWMDKTNDKWLNNDWEGSQAKRHVGRISGWLSVNSSQRMELTTAKSKGVRFGRKRKWQEEKGKCESTFVYGGSGHVVETQSRVHVIHVLQESEEILHLLKCDALHRMEGQKKKNHRHWRMEIKSFLQFYLKLLLHHRFVKNQPKIVMTGAVTTQWHFWAQLIRVAQTTGARGAEESANTHTDERLRLKRKGEQTAEDTRARERDWADATPLMNLFAKESEQLVFGRKNHFSHLRYRMCWRSETKRGGGVEVHREMPTLAAPSPAFVFCLEGIAASLLLFIFFYSLITAFNHGALLIVAQSDICAALMYTNKMLCNG